MIKKSEEEEMKKEQVKVPELPVAGEITKK